MHTVHGGFDHSVGPFPALNNALDMLDGLRSEVLLSRLSADTCRHIFNNEKLATMFQCVSYSGIYHCLFHSEFSFISPSDLELDPQIGVRLVQGYDLDNCPVRIAALNMQWPARFRVTKDETTWAIFVFKVPAFTGC
jgi:hypothetical protein